MALLLNCDSLTKHYGPRLLFRGISISFDDTERTGLIGANGSGKSTLLKILAGLEQPDSGTLTTRRGLRIGYLPQEEVFEPGLTVEQVVERGAAAAYADEHERSVQTQILLSRMQFPDTQQPAGALSGGWRKRLSIARALIAKPDLLLLDEPTNHLDLSGIIWLEKLLAGAPFSFLLVSHDRYFLENTTNRIVELSRAYADGYLSAGGSYSTFLEKRDEHLAAQARTQQALESRVRREVEWLRRGAKARTTKAKGRIEQAGEMMRELGEVRARNVAGNTAAAGIDFTATDRKTRKLLWTKRVSKSAGDRVLFRDLDLVLSPGTRLGLLGSNGSGKTTLIRLLAGQDVPDAGTVERADGLRVVFFEQNRASLERSQTLRQALSPSGTDTVVFRDRPMHITGWAKQFLFRSEQLDLPVSELSGGEQARVLLARMMLRPADVLILDEPTNDLDIPSLEVLEESLADFPGALVLVTHDRYLLDRASNVILSIDGDGGTGFYADYHQWQSAQEERDAAAKAEAKPATRAANVSPAPAAAPARARLTWKEQRELEGMEQAILVAESAVQAAQRLTEDPAVLRDHQRLHEAYDRLAAGEQRVKELYARWEELEAKRG